MQVSLGKLRKKLDEEQIRQFEVWMDRYEGSCRHVILDGPNVARRSLPLRVRAEFRPDQIQAVKDKLEEAGYNVSIVLPHRYYVEQTEDVTKCIQQWIDQEQVFITPDSVVDDWFWIYACLRNPNALVVTYDQLRDHLTSMEKQQMPRGRLEQWRDSVAVQHSVLLQEYDHTRPLRATDIEIHMPSGTDRRIHVDDQCVRVPVDDNSWMSFCGPKKT